MIQIDDTIISLSVIEVKFACDLKACKGCCCRYGDAGAPLTGEEAAILESVYQEIKPFMRKEGIMAVENQGISIRDIEGDIVTPLVNNEECAFAAIDDGIFKCAIEKAYIAGRIKFKKPASCHLFPLRVKNFTDFRAVNYEEWPICKPALAAGNKSGTRLYRFLKEPLVRVFGKEWYKKLSFAAGEYDKNKWQWNS